MGLVYLLFIAALDLAGIIFNMRMLRRSFKDKTKYKFLQKCRTLTICQCVCQVTILVTNAVQSWPGFGFQSCNVFRGLLISMTFLLACNMAAILIHRDSGYPFVTYGNQEVYSKLKLPAALAIIGSTTVCYSCFSQEFLSQMAVEGILFVVTMAFVALLYAAVSKNNIIHDHLADTSTKTSTSTSFSLWSVCQENKMSLLFMASLLTFLAVLLSAFPRSSFSLDFEQTKIFQEVMYSLITRFVVGIALPLTICDLIDSSYEENERKIIVI